HKGETKMDRQLIRKRKKRKKIFWFLIFPLILFLGVGVSYGTYLYTKAKSMMDDSYHELDGREEKSNLREKKVDPNIDNVSILFIGIDESEKRSQGEHTRSDALM